jgi:hypothetical protein
MVSREVRGARRELALNFLLSGRGTVAFGHQLALRPERDYIRCEVTLPSTTPRTAEAYPAVIAAANAYLAKSSLAQIAEVRRLEWFVVDNSGPEPLQLWPRP